ncbi:MAG TPA: hypothetical protein VHV83_03640 [Armatimonadota bacterium]|nr:hypothetical protein [Armatimonadota bacterium]
MHTQLSTRLVLCAVLLSGFRLMAVHAEPQSNTATSRTVQRPSPVTSTAVARKIVQAFKMKNWARVARSVHPQKGVRFSPYANVNVRRDRLFTARQIRTAWNRPTRYLWGVYDGSGKPIRLTFAEYYAKFIYDRDFANAPFVSVNRSRAQGNTINNARQVYPNADIVEFYFPNSNENTLDWRALRLVLERWRGSWYLVGVIHDQWTI